MEDKYQERTRRKLSGILSADVVGYSRLMEEDETSTILCLEENKKLIGELIEEFKGRIVDAPGDNILAEFSSVVNAVECAVTIQNKLHEKNTLLPEKNRMDFRIGVNLGDVISEDGKIYGDGVNIAARIEGIAEPGIVCISRTAYDQVKSKLKFGYEYLGEYNLKNISEPVRIYRVLTDPDTAGKVIGEKRFLGRITRRAAMVIIIFLFFASAGSIGWIIYSHQFRKVEQPQLDKMAYSLPKKISIAVLPFVNLSDDQDYFSDGLTEEIITGLSKDPDLSVISRNSSFAYKDESVKIQQVGKDLGVSYVLEGSVRRDNNKIRITAELIDAVKGYNIWTETYDRENEDFLSIQTDIMWHIFREVHIRLIDGERKPDFSPVKKVSLEYTETFYLLYRYYKERSPESLKEAKKLADKLIGIEPDPWVYFMRGSILVALNGFKDSNSSQYLKDAEKNAQEAKKLDRGAGLALSGQICLAKRDLAAALDYYNRWAEYAPDSANAHFGVGLVLILLKKYDEAVRQYKIGFKINPRPEIQHTVFLGIAYSSPSPDGFSNMKKATETLLSALVPNQNNFLAHTYLTLIYAYENQMEKARDQAKAMMMIMPFFSVEIYRSWLPADEKITMFQKGLLKKAGIPETGKGWYPFR